MKIDISPRVETLEDCGIVHTDNAPLAVKTGVVASLAGTGAIEDKPPIWVIQFCRTQGPRRTAPVLSGESLLKTPLPPRDGGVDIGGERFTEVRGVSDDSLDPTLDLGILHRPNDYIMRSSPPGRGSSFAAGLIK